VERRHSLHPQSQSETVPCSLAIEGRPKNKGFEGPSSSGSRGPQIKFAGIRSLQRTAYSSLPTTFSFLESGDIRQGRAENILIRTRTTQTCHTPGDKP